MFIKVQAPILRARDVLRLIAMATESSITSISVPIFTRDQSLIQTSSAVRFLIVIATPWWIQKMRVQTSLVHRILIQRRTAAPDW